MNIQENNKLIAEFMGAKRTAIEGLQKPIWYPVNGMSKYEDQLKYHTSWDWLMPVIDKITSDDTYPSYIDHTSSMVDKGGVEINTRFIEVTYNNVIDFIEWHKNK